MMPEKTALLTHEFSQTGDLHKLIALPENDLVADLDPEFLRIIICHQDPRPAENFHHHFR